MAAYRVLQKTDFAPISARLGTVSCRLLAGRDLDVAAFTATSEFATDSRLRRSAKRLPLGELDSLSRALLTVLLAFLHARIAGEKTVLTQRRAQFRVEARNRPRQSHAHRSSLAANAAAMRGHNHVNLIGQASKLQRLDRVVLPCEIREIDVHCPLVDRELAASRTKEHARDRFFAASCAVKPSFRGCW